VRDYSIRELFKINKDAKDILKDLCYGNGYVLVNGKMVQTGVCVQNKIQEIYKDK